MPLLRSGIAAIAVLLAAPAGAQSAPVSIALDWTPNTNHVGIYVAEALGYYEAEGLEVTILPYSDTSASMLVANRVADFGILGGTSLFILGAAGADLVATYAVMQTETGRLVFNGDRDDIQSPRDLDGKIYAGFGSAWEDRLIGDIIRADGGKGDYQTVTLGTSAYEALANGAVDFTLEVYTWEGVKAELDGTEQRAFRYGDFGVPDQHTTLIGSSSAYLEENADLARAFVAATARGYDYAVDNPEAAADLLIAANADMLTDGKLVHASMKTLVDGHYLRTEDGVIGRMDPAKMEAMMQYMFDGEMLRDPDGALLTEKPDASRFYSNDYLPAR